MDLNRLTLLDKRLPTMAKIMSNKDSLQIHMDEKGIGVEYEFFVTNDGIMQVLTVKEIKLSYI